MEPVFLKEVFDMVEPTDEFPIIGNNQVLEHDNDDKLFISILIKEKRYES